MINPFHTKVDKFISENKAVELGYINPELKEFEQDVLDYNEQAYFLIDNNDKLIKIKRNGN